MPCTGVVIVAAGLGTRLGLGIPKAFVPLAGEPMLAHALRGLTGLPGRIAMAVVVPADDPERRDLAELLVRSECRELGDRLISVRIVDGGNERHVSVRAGLDALPDSCDVVLVHDAARALATPQFIASIAGTVRATGHGIVPALRVTDTIQRVDARGTIIETVDREPLRAVQTPQGFVFEELRAAYSRSDVATTDDAGTFLAAGGCVETVPGDTAAFKITTPSDLERAEAMLAERNIAGGPQSEPQQTLRVGVGTDIHAFDDASPCWLAGIHFPDERGLAGHSDGDAASHAIVDALLGAAGLGSIGSVFGTDDPRFERAHGVTFLNATRELLAAVGCRPHNVSVQVVCQRPRFGDRAAEASQVLSDALGAPVSVSATTSDGLGFMGARNEGVFAIATALVAIERDSARVNTVTAG